MYEIILKVDGMKCGMCEAHVNDAVRDNFNVKKVKSSHSKGQTVILTEEDMDEKKLSNIVSATGYIVTEVQKKPYEKKGLFSRK
ncbi:MAG: cation transporter [Anaerovoracaceae bacterium]